MKKKNDIFKIAETITEIIGWIAIVISFTLLGILVALVINYNFHTTIGLIIAILIGTLLALVGIKVAGKSYKGKGTVTFLSRVNASPDLDKSRLNK